MSWMCAMQKSIVLKTGFALLIVLGWTILAGIEGEQANWNDVITFRIPIWNRQ